MIACMVLATIFFGVFVILYLGAGNEVSEVMLNCCCEMRIEEIKKLQIAMKLSEAKTRKNGGIDIKAQKKYAGKLQKKLKAAQKQLEIYQKRKVAGLDLIPVAGYRLLQILKWDASNKNVKVMFEKCQRYKEKKEAMNYTYYIYGNMFGNIVLGICIAFLTAGVAIAAGVGVKAAVMGLAVFVLFVVIGYLPYDEVNQTVNRRAEEIEQAFPQLISQMTLLVVAGMEVNRAWMISSQGGQTTLYEEMNRVNIDLENNVAPADAYGKFITRCNNKYATKLATAIIQNLSKGNSEIVSLFRQLNAESWSEHRHSARRTCEKIQSKLFLPTMLMFAGILLLVIVPVMSGFSF